MRISSAAILTLAALAASNVDNQATAATDLTPVADDKKGENVVIPVLEDTPAPTQAIAQPETLAVPQFSSVNSNQLSVNNKQVKPQKQENKQPAQVVIKNSPTPPISPSPNPPISPNPPLPPSQILLSKPIVIL